MNEEFSSLSISLTKKLDNNEKKKNGIYFTPKSIINSMIDKILSKKKDIKYVLEPSCGSCEILNILDNKLNDIEIDAIELNSTIFEEIKTLEYKNKVNFENMNYLNFESKVKYDLIIGNPPYVVLPKKEVDSYYFDYFEGRPNIFILFIVKALKELNDKGILSFVLPKSFMNCQYYDKLRGYINENLKILSIEDYSSAKYIETGQATIVFIAQKRKGMNKKYVLKFGGNTVFNTKDNIVKLKEYYDGATTLKKLGFKVSVGKVVWNQVKSKLTDDEEKTRLIYSSDIVNNELSMKKYKNPEKKNFIEKDGNNDLLLVVNRGYGNGKYKFTYCLIDTEKKYLVENHLICIKSVNNLERNELLEKYNLIINSLKSKKTQNFVDLYFGNNAMNTKELGEVMPIYL